MNEPDDFVFQYHDGEKVVFADPLQTHRALIRETAGALGQLLKDARCSDHAISFPAVERLLAASRAAFQLKPFDRLTNQGLKERHVYRILKDFLQLVASEKKSGESMPNSPPSTVSVS